MQQAVNWDEPRPADHALLEVVSELDNECAAAIIRQVRRSVREGSGTVVVDFGHVPGVSLAGLASLFDRARRAGLLSRIVFRVDDPLLRRFFANVRGVSLDLLN